MDTRWGIGKSRAFSLELQKRMVARGIHTAEVSRRINKNGGQVSDRMMRYIYEGSRPPSLRLIEAIVAAIGASTVEAERLHRAAALDRGFKIGSVDG